MWQAQGQQLGDRVAVRLPNGRSYLDVLVACAIGRFVAVSVNPKFSEAEAQSIIDRTGCALVVDEPLAAPEADCSSEAEPADRFVVFTTSGTTSAPKLVVHSQRSIASHAREVVGRFGYSSDSVVAVVMPLCGTFGLASFFGALAGDATIHLVAAFDAERVAGLIESEQVTSVHGSDDMFHRLLATGRNLTSVQCAGYGRFNTSLDGIVERADEVGLTLTGVYGMSECQALFALRDPRDPVASRWRGGGTLTSASASYRVVDGELHLRGPSLFDGYLAEGGAEIDRDLTDRHFDDDWFRTGDLGEGGDDRTFTYLTRMGDVLRLGGFLVAPAEIENVLTEIPAITAAQVVVAERAEGSRPVAFVLAHGDVDEQEVIAHCLERLAKFKCPVRAVRLREFPVTDGPNGVKIQRARLREMAAQLDLDPPA